MRTAGVKITGNAPAGLLRVKDKYGLEFARDVERVLRLETAHFTSGQWLGSGSAGMEAVSSLFPFGWSSLQQYADSVGLASGWFFTKSYNENGTGKRKTFIGFRDTGVFVDFFAWFIKTKRGGDVVSWYMLPNANDPTITAKRAKYRTSLNSITPKFV